MSSLINSCNNTRICPDYDHDINDFNSLGMVVLSAIPVNDMLIQSFSRLKADPFLKGAWCFRYRAFAQGVCFNNGYIKWSKDNTFFQEKDINCYAGGIERRFEAAEPILREYTQQVMNCQVYKRLRGSDNFKIGVHQIRITCSENNLGLPVPEGFHQDGMDYVSIHCIDQNNAVGGVSLLRQGTLDGRCVFERNLEKCTGLIFNDREYFHYSTPIYPKEKRLGYRDIIVMTFLRC